MPDMPARRAWTRRELLLALRLYMTTDFGRLHRSNPDVLALAAAIGRTPSAVAMKACNFASLDPALHQTGLSSTSRADRQIWNEFHADSESLANEVEVAAAETVIPAPSVIPAQAGIQQPPTDAQQTIPLSPALGSPTPASPIAGERAGVRGQPDSPRGTSPVIPAQAGIQQPPIGVRTVPLAPPAGPTDAEALVRARRVQAFFRRAVLVSYNGRCALTGLPVAALLNASHIIPWSVSTPRRADPTNGLCLSVLFDRAFDRGLLTFDEDLRVVLSRALKEHLPQPHLPCLLTAAEGATLHLPTRFPPDAVALEYHREHVFCA
jgi:putative restriction endonuclease